MERYIGIDVHAASCTLAVASERGRLLRTMVVETNGEALVDALRCIAGHRRVVFEEGTQAGWWSCWSRMCTRWWWLSSPAVQSRVPSPAVAPSISRSAPHIPTQAPGITPGTTAPPTGA